MTGGGISELSVPVDLTPFEAEHFIQQIEPLDLETVGDKAFLDQHERVDKLSAQAHYQAEDKTDEYIVDLLNTHEKVPVLVHNLITVETWKEHCFPHLKEHVSTLSSLRSYIPIYSEASLVSLVEMCLYHSQSCETAGDSLVDLIDYVYRKLTYLVQHPNAKLYSWPPQSTEEALAKSEVDLLNEQFLDIEFQICMSALNICRYLTDHRQHLPLTLTTRLLENHDILLTLVPLMEKAPWIRKRRGQFEKFEKNVWKVIEEDDLCTLPKMSSQLWLTMYNLIMDSQCRQRYEMRGHRKDNLLRLRRFLNEIVFDQIPPLVELLRTLEELAIAGQLTQVQTTNLPGQRPNPSDSISSAFFVELVAEVRESLMQRYRGRWESVARTQKEEIFTKETEAEMKRLPDLMCIPRLDDEDEPETLEARVGQNAFEGKKTSDDWIAEVARDIGIEPRKPGSKESIGETTATASESENADKENAVPEINFDTPAMRELYQKVHGRKGAPPTVDAVPQGDIDEMD
ncbi:unnamed protein product [Amoebophrya sp. A25]|nr:unnamed protein product [Amoebophrya sp. A25]|eukprot:GSA25T00024540001.1